MDGSKSTLKSVKCLHFSPIVLHATALGTSKALLLHKTATLWRRKRSGVELRALAVLIQQV